MLTFPFTQEMVIVQKKNISWSKSTSQVSNCFENTQESTHSIRSKAMNAERDRMATRGPLGGNIKETTRLETRF